MLRLALFIGLLLATIASRAEEPKAPPAKTAESLGIVVSPETTIITEPLMADGLPDYEAYLLKKLSEGVTPENNAAVPLLKAVWPGRPDFGPPEDKVLEAIGLSSNNLAKQPATLSEASLTEALSKLTHANNSTDWLYRFGDDLKQLSSRPWQAEQAPEIATWLENRSEAFALLARASQCSRYYLPPGEFLNGKREFTNDLIPLDLIICARQSLEIRQMNATGEGQFQAAWADLLTQYRLSSCCRFYPCFFGEIASNGLESKALEKAATVFHHCNPTEQEALQRLQEIDKLFLSQLSVKPIEAERLFATATLVALAIAPDNFHIEYYKDYAGIEIDKPINWANELTATNLRHNAAAEILRLSNRDEQRHRLEDEISRASLQLKDLQVDEMDELSPKIRTSVLTAFNNSNFWEAFRNLLYSRDRRVAAQGIGRLSAALAAHRAKHGSYPNTLDELSPALLAELPLDAFSNKPFIYQRKPDGGYLLYSVGVNRVDDGGDSLFADIIDGEHVLGPPDYTNVGDDIVIRVPMPAFKKPLPINQPVE